MPFTTREEYLTCAMHEMSSWFDGPFPENVSVSCGWPSKSALSSKKRRIGEAWSSENSKDKKFQLFISPYLDKPIDVLHTLLHEMIHAFVGLECGHKGEFKRVALFLGCEGKMTATFPGEDQIKRLNVVSRTAGPYPHGSLDKRMINGDRKQGTRMLKAICPGCEYTVRTTAKWLETGLPTCPCGTEMTCDT